MNSYGFSSVEKPQTEKKGIETFTYRIDIENRTGKEIVTVDWQVDFIHPLTGEVVATHEFISRERISPGARKTVTAVSYSLPTTTIDIGLLIRNKNRPYLELAKIRSITFAG